MTVNDHQRKIEKLKSRLFKRRKEKAKKEGSEICELHNCKLVKGQVELRFGLPDLSHEYIDASTKLFPNSKLVIYGGGSLPVIDEETGEPDIPTVAEVKYCKKCREIEEDWLKRHSAK